MDTQDPKLKESEIKAEESDNEKEETVVANTDPEKKVG